MRKRHPLFQPSTTEKENLSLRIHKTLDLVEKIARTSPEIPSPKLDSLLKKIQKIQRSVAAHDEELLNSNVSQNNTLSLETDVGILKSSLSSLAEEIESLKYLIEQSINSSLGSHHQVVQSVLAEIYKNLPIIHGEASLEDLDMGNKSIINLQTPEQSSLSCAASTHYIQNQLLPIEEKLNDAIEKISYHETIVTTWQRQTISSLGGAFQGNVDMRGHRLSGLGFPKEDSDAISREYLESYIQNQHPEVSTKERRQHKLPRKTNLIYTLGANSKQENPLTLELLFSGLVGFVWKAADLKHQGTFPYGSLKFEETHEEMCNFIQMPSELSGVYPGMYTWSLTFTALIPSILGIQKPQIHINTRYHQPAWSVSQDKLAIPKAESIELPIIGKITYGGQSYDIIELSASHKQHSQTFVVAPNFHGISMQALNTMKTTDGKPVDLNVIHATLSCFWEAF